MSPSPITVRLILGVDTVPAAEFETFYPPRQDEMVDVGDRRFELSGRFVWKHHDVHVRGMKIRVESELTIYCREVKL